MGGKKKRVVAPARAVVESVAARIRGEVVHAAVEHAMVARERTRAVEVLVGNLTGGEPGTALKLLTLLTDRETLKVVHRKLHDLGWHRPWGYDQHHALYKALCEFFGDDDAHLR